MARVFIPAQWRDLTGSVAEVLVEGGVLAELITDLDRQFPGIGERACDDGELAPALAVSVDGRIVTRGLRSPVQPTSEVHFLPAIGGG